MKKRNLLMLCLSMFLWLACGNLSLAAEIASGKDNNIEWTIDETGLLTITGTGDYSGVGVEDEDRAVPQWYEYCDTITSAKITASGMTSACGLFTGCYMLKEIDFSEWDTSNITNMSYMFDGCSSLMTLDLSKFNTSKTKNMSYMFFDCDNLGVLDLSNFEIGENVYTDSMLWLYGSLHTLMMPANVQSTIALGSGNGKIWYDADGNSKDAVQIRLTEPMTYTFEKYKGVSGKDNNIEWIIDESGLLIISGSGDYEGVPKWEVEDEDAIMVPQWYKYSNYIQTANVNVTGMTSARSMFDGCKNLTQVNFENFDTSEITDMSSMFCMCWNLQELDLSQFDTTNVTNMSWMFASCGVKNLDLKSFDTSNVRDMSWMFYGSDQYMATSLETVDLSSFNTANVETMECMFALTDALKEIDISSFEIGEDIDVSGIFDMSNIQIIKAPAGLCQAVPLPTSSIVSGNLAWYDEAENIVRNMEMELSVPMTYTRKEFNGASGKDKDLNWEVTKEGVLTVTGKGDYADKAADTPEWVNCSAFIKSAVIDVTDITNAGAMFNACTNLTNVTWKNFDTSKVTTMSNMFASCNSLETVDLSTFNTESLTDMSWMFAGCENLKSINFGQFNTSNVTNMTGVFAACHSLASVDVSNFDTRKVTSMNAMFFGAYLTSLDLSNFTITSNVAGVDGFLQDCTIKTLVMPANVPGGIYLPLTDYDEENEPAWYDENGKVVEYAEAGLSKPMKYLQRKRLEVIPVTEISLASSVELTVGETKTLTATVSPENADYPMVTWSSNNPAIAVVDNGKITAVGEGETKIIVIAHNDIAAECIVKVVKKPEEVKPEPPVEPEKPQPVEVTEVKLSVNAVSIQKGEKETITATVLPENADNKAITWTTNDPSIATVNNGEITAVEEGTAVITVTSANGKSAECTVTVTLIPKVTLNAKKFTLQRGKSTTALKVKTKVPSDDKVESWTSSDTAIATVSSTGKVKGIKVGKATITVTMKSGATASCEVTVQKGKVKTKSLSINSKKLTMLKGTKETLKVTRNPISATEKITWSTSNKSVATVDKNGKVSAKKAGTAKITAKTTNGKKVTCTVTVKNPSIVLKKKSGTVKVGKTLKIAIKSIYPKDDKIKSFKTSNKKIAKVDKNGVITGVKKGTATITVTTKKGAKATFKVTVKK